MIRKDLVNVNGDNEQYRGQKKREDLESLFQGKEEPHVEHN